MRRAERMLSEVTPHNLVRAQIPPPNACGIVPIVLPPPNAVNCYFRVSYAIWGGALTDDKSLGVERFNDLVVLRTALNTYSFGGAVNIDLVVVGEVDDRAFGSRPSTMATSFCDEGYVVGGC